MTPENPFSEDPVAAQRQEIIARANINESNIIRTPEQVVIPPEEAVQWFEGGQFKVEELPEDRAAKVLDNIENLKQTSPNEVADQTSLEREFIRTFAENADALERTTVDKIPGGPARLIRIRETTKRLKSLIQ